MQSPMYNQSGIQQFAQAQLLLLGMQQQQQHQQQQQLQQQQQQQLQQQTQQQFQFQQHWQQQKRQPTMLRPGVANTPDRVITLDESDDEEDDEKQRTLFCANLDERVTEELLYEVFLQAGPIESVRIPKDNVGRQRTFGFVTYVHRCSVPYAMQLYQGLTLYRRLLTIRFQGENSVAGSPTSRRSAPGDSELSAEMRATKNDIIPTGTYQVATLTSAVNPFKRDERCDRVNGRGSGQHVPKYASSAHQRSQHSSAAPYRSRSGGDATDRNNHDRFNHDSSSSSRLSSHGGNGNSHRHSARKGINRR